MGRSSYTTQFKKECVQLVDEGVDIQQVALEKNVSVRNLKNWVKGVGVRDLLQEKYTKVYIGVNILNSKHEKFEREAKKEGVPIRTYLKKKVELNLNEK